MWGIHPIRSVPLDLSEIAPWTVAFSGSRGGIVTRTTSKTSRVLRKGTVMLQLEWVLFLFLRLVLSSLCASSSPSSPDSWVFYFRSLPPLSHFGSTCIFSSSLVLIFFFFSCKYVSCFMSLLFLSTHDKGLRVVDRTPLTLQKTTKHPGLGLDLEAREEWAEFRVFSASKC